MGSWGYENFDSDNALNMLAVWINKIIGHVRETFTLDSDDTPYKGYGAQEIIANVDILATLCEHYNFYLDLEGEEVSKWKQDYLNTYDRISSRYKNQKDIDAVKQPRAVIVATFDRFQRIVDSLYEEDQE